jgi:hypothetical protein
MPRDEPVGSLGRLALKPTEFREQVGLIGFAVLHNVPPSFDDSRSDQLPCKVAPNRAREKIATKYCCEYRDQPLLPMARLNV